MTTDEVNVGKSAGEKERPTRASDDLPIRMPAVDIYEDGDSIMLDANLPGVEANGLEVTIDDGSLTIQGAAKSERPAGLRLVRWEYEPGLFRRSFELSDRIDVNAIKARFKNGTLHVELPKREELKPRRIQVKPE